MKAGVVEAAVISPDRPGAWLTTPTPVVGLSYVAVDVKLGGSAPRDKQARLG